MFPKKVLLSQNIIDIRNEKIKVGIIGNGFVGEAQAFAFSSVADVYIFDIDPLNQQYIESINDCDFVFICVPTPMN